MPNDNKTITGMVIDGARQDASVVSVAASQSDPERRARAYRASIASGLPLDVVERNLDEIEKRLTQGKKWDPESLLKEAPTLLQSLRRRSEVAPVVRDDLEALKGLEWAFSGRGETRGAVVSGWKSVGLQQEYSNLQNKEMLGPLTEEEKVRLQQIEADPIWQRMEKGFYAEGFFQEMLPGTASFARQQVEALKAGAWGYAAGAVIGGAGGALVGAVAPTPGPEDPLAIGAGAAKGAALGGRILSRTAAYQHMASLERGLAWSEFKNLTDVDGNPIDRDVARIGAFAYGYLSAGIELFALNEFLKMFGEGGEMVAKQLSRKTVAELLRNKTVQQRLKSVVKGTGAEIGEEGAQQALQVIIGEAMRGNTDIASVTGAAIKEAFAAMRDAAPGIIPFGVGGVAVQMRQHQKEQRKAAKNQEMFDALAQSAAKSKGVQIDPDITGSVVNDIAGAKGVPYVFTDVAAWNNYWSAQNQDPKEVYKTVVGDTASYDEAMARGPEGQGNIAIPTGVWHSKIAPTPHHAPLILDSTLVPGTPSIRQQAEFEKQSTEKAQQAVAEQIEFLRKNAPTNLEQARIQQWSSQLQRTGKRTQEQAEAEVSLLGRYFRVMLDRVNRERERQGLTTLTWDQLWGDYELEFTDKELIVKKGGGLLGASQEEAERGAQATEAFGPRVSRWTFEPPGADMPMEAAGYLDVSDEDLDTARAMITQDETGSWRIFDPEGNEVGGMPQGFESMQDAMAAAERVFAPRIMEQNPQMETMGEPFKAFFEGSSVIDYNKNPDIQYHWTKIPGVFDAFRPWSHFGTPKAASDRYKQVTLTSWFGEDQPVHGKMGGTFPVFLNIKSPLFMTDIYSWEDPVHVAKVILATYAPTSARAQQALEFFEDFGNYSNAQITGEFAPRTWKLQKSMEKGHQALSGMTPKQVEAYAKKQGESPAQANKFFQYNTKNSGYKLSNDATERLISVLLAFASGDGAEIGGETVVLDNIDGADRATGFRLITQILEDEGFDGIQYINAAEDPGSMSWISFNPTQVKSAIGNVGLREREKGFSPEDPRIWAQSPLEAEATVGMNDVLQNLTEEERAEVDKTIAKEIVSLLERLPVDAKDFAAAAVRGKAAKGWYEKSAKALVNVFQFEAPRFAALLAAMSPQVLVETNLRSALVMWTEWKKAGSPSEASEIDALYDRVAERDRSTMLLRTESWKPNVVRALSEEDPEQARLSGMKVDSFQHNLRGFVNRVTLDLWMAAFSGIDAGLLGSKATQKRPRGYSGAYLTLTARVREAAKILSEISGEEWTPSEVQETVWAWTLAIGVEGDKATNKGRSLAEMVASGEVDETLKTAAAPFSVLLYDDSFARILEGTEYGERIRGTADRVAAERAQAVSRTPEEESFLAREDTQARLARAVERMEGRRAELKTAPVIRVAWEAIPGKTTPVGSWLVQQDYATQLEFTQKVNPGFETELAKRLIAALKGKKRPTFAPMNSRGAYDTRVVPNVVATIEGGSPSQEKNLATTMSALIGFVRDQDAVAWMKPRPALIQDKIAPKGISIKRKKAWDDASSRRLFDELSTVFGAAAGFTQVSSDTVLVINYGMAETDDAFFRGVGDAEAKLREELGIVEAVYFGTESEYVDKERFYGTLEDVRELATRATGSPDLFEWLLRERQRTRDAGSRFARSRGADLRRLRDELRGVRPEGEGESASVPPAAVLQADQVVPPRFTAKPVHPLATSAVGVHYSTKAGLSELDPTFAGTGSAGAERKRFGIGRYGLAPGAARRVYFYVQNDGEVLPTPERAVVGSEVYRVQLDNLYDMKADPLGLIAQAGSDLDTLETLVSQAGFDGILAPPGPGQRSPIAVVFDLGDSKIPVQSVSEAARVLSQEKKKKPRGQILIPPGRGPRSFTISLLEGADLSTVLHESGHLWLELLGDLVERGDAPHDMKADYATLLAWLGVKSRDEIGQEHHEKMARGLEQYFREGKAPIETLKQIFEKFKLWLLEIYRSASELDVELTDDVRRVLDRMLATEDEIASAEAVSGASFALTQDQLGMSGVEFEQYKKLMDEAHAAAIAELQEKQLKEQRSEISSAVKKARAAIDREVEDELSQRPVYKLAKFLAGKGDELVHESMRGRKLNRESTLAALAEAGVDSATQRKLIPGFWMSSENGIEPDDLAPWFGYGSGAEMLHALATRTPLKEAKAAEVDARFKARRPDLVSMSEDAEKRSREALRSVHNPRRFELLMAELRALGKWAGQSFPGASQFEAVAREYIGKTIGMHIKRLPDEYLRQERLAAERAFKAAYAKDWNAAFEAKYQQALYYSLWSEATRSAERFDKGLRFLRMMATPKAAARLVRGGAQFVDQISAILETIELKNRTNKEIEKRQGLREFIAEQIANNNDAIVDAALIEKIALERRNWKELTVDEMEGIVTSVDNIRTLAYQERTRLSEGKRVDWEEAKDLLIDGITSAFPNAKQIPIQDEALASATDKTKSFARWVAASLKRVELTIDQLDDKNPNGIWNRMVWKPLVAAQAEENDLTLRYTQRLLELYEGLPAEQRKALNKKVVVPGMARKDGSPLVVDRSFLLAVALNAGNAGNYQRLIDGAPDDVQTWGIDQVEAMLSMLTREEWELVQGTWDLLEGLWPKVEALEKKLTGVAPPKVAPTPFKRTLADGTEIILRGGYYPLVYDRRYGGRAARLAASENVAGLFDSAYARWITPHGHTKARVENYKEPLKLSMAVLPAHLQQVIHDLTHREALISVWKTITDKEINRTMRRHMGQEATDAFEQWVKDVANARTDEVVAGNHALLKFARTTRMNATVMGLGWKVYLATQNYANFVNALEFVSPNDLRKAMMIIARDLRGTVNEVNAKSPVMRHRFNARDRDAREAMNSLLGKNGIIAHSKRSAFYLQAMTDLHVAYPTWIAAYNRQLGKTKDEEAAIQYADRAVRLALGSGFHMDLSAWQRGGELQKSMAMFYGWFAVVANRFAAMKYDAVRSYRQGGGSATAGAISVAKDLPRFIGRMMAFWFIPAVLSEIFMFRPPQPPEDADDEERNKYLAEWVAMKAAVYALASIPLVREAASYWEKGFAPRANPSVELLKSTVDATAKTAKAISTMEPDDIEKAIRNDMRAVGYATGLPLGQVDLTWRGAVELMEEEAESPADYMKLIAGPERREARGGAR